MPLVGCKIPRRFLRGGVWFPPPPPCSLPGPDSAKYRMHIFMHVFVFNISKFSPIFYRYLCASIIFFNGSGVALDSCSSPRTEGAVPVGFALSVPIHCNPGSSNRFSLSGEPRGKQVFSPQVAAVPSGTFDHGFLRKNLQARRTPSQSEIGSKTNIQYETP